MERVQLNLKDFVESLESWGKQIRANDAANTLPITDTRIFFYTGVRQAGFTEEIVNMFDPEQDAYIATNHFLVDEFVERMGGVSCKTAIINANDFEKSVRKMLGSRIRRVYIDVSPAIIFSRAVRIRRLIRIIEEKILNDDAVYIIT